MWRNTYLQIVVSFVLFIFVALYFPKLEYDQSLINLALSLTTFTFAIFLSFSIARLHTRLSNIRTLLREDDASIVTIHVYMKLFGKKERQKFLALVDAYLMAQLDYRLIDLSRTYPQLESLHLFLASLRVRSQKQEALKDRVLELADDMEKRHRIVVVHIRDSMLSYEWISLLVLASTTWFMLLLVNNGTGMMTVILGLIATSLVLFLAILQDLNNLSWQERSWIHEPLSRLFVSLGLLPYVPVSITKLTKRSYLNTLETYRIAIYPNPYPDMRGKKVKIVKQ